MHIDNHLVAGTAGGVITALLLHPLDLVKVRLQVQDGRVVVTRYTGVFSAVRTIASQEGLRGFYRGAVPGAWGSGASWGLYFYFYERAKRRMLPAADKQLPPPASQPKAASGGAGGGSSSSSSNGGGGALASGPGRPAQSPPPPPAKLSVAQHLYAAWEGGTITVFFTNPLWLVKTRMQLQTTTSGNISGAMPAATAAAAAAAAAGGAAAHGHQHHAPPLRPYSGMLHALATIVREEGPLGLYRGLLPALLLVSHGMVQFAVYEELKAAMETMAQRRERRLARLAAERRARSSDSGGSSDSGATSTAPADGGLLHAVAGGVSHSTRLFAAGVISKAVATTATYPYQVIKARLQQRHAGPEEARPYRGVWDATRKIAAHEGVRGFYKGFVANLLRVAPQSALTLVAYENVLAALNALTLTSPSSGAAVR